MPLWPNFIGPAYRARSQSIAADVLKNLYTEISENPSDAKQSNYYGTPGLKFFLSVGSAECRGSFSQDGRTFTVYGPTLYEIDTGGMSATILGTVANNGQPVSFASNGRGGEQLAISAGGKLYIFKLTTNVFSGPIILPLTHAAVMICFIDGYFLLMEADSIRVWFSALEDGTLWDALDFFARSETSDNLVGIAVIRDRVWALGSQTSEVYYDSGDADNPFVPYPGSVMQEGLVSPWALTVLGEALYWLAQDGNGRNRMVSTTDYNPVVISTPPISYAIAQYQTTTDCEVLAYEQEGHPFVVWTFPSGDQTWAWDARESQWHERDNFNEMTGQGHRWRARGVCAAGDLIIVGDFENGNLYTLDLDTCQDNGKTIRRMRRAPYPSAENQWIFVNRIEMGIQSGAGLTVGQGSNPELMLRVSRDSGSTWSDIITTTLGKVGNYMARAIWYRLGRVRADRLVIEVTQTDPVRTVWGPGLWLKVTAGSGQL